MVLSTTEIVIQTIFTMKLFIVVILLFVTLLSITALPSYDNDVDYYGEYPEANESEGEAAYDYPEEILY